MEINTTIKHCEKVLSNNYSLEVLWKSLLLETCTLAQH